MARGVEQPEVFVTQPSWLDQKSDKLAELASQWQHPVTFNCCHLHVRAMRRMRIVLLCIPPYTVEDQHSPVDVISDSPPHRTMLVEPRRYQSLYYRPVETSYFNRIHSGSRNISVHYRYRLEITIRRTRTGLRVIVGSSHGSNR